ncbi:cellulase family glycosylhydrolase [Anaeromicropila herbilytica]|uniref:Endoglucanase n=1 Tax=Anaeromicropila herbilytica TaxID=2785025 RepID=A0A7R7ELH0_9FIRM|nr:cellulase family glycosylhydrolase [Anaeromicropila herbilytica]BCN30770.1 endoglucanase [Anaeromicropila herbilytica]
MKTKKRRMMSLLLILVMMCTYVVGPNSFTAYAADENTVQDGVAEEVVLFEGSNTSTNWGQAVTLYAGKGFSKSNLTSDAEIAVTYQSDKEPIISLQSWTHNNIWQNVPAKYTKGGVAYFSVSDLMDAYASAYGTGYLTPFQDLDAINISDAGVDLTVTKVTITSKGINNNCYTQVGEVTKVTAKAYAQNTTNDWTWMGMDNVVNLLYKTNTSLGAKNTSNIFANVNSSANFGIQISDEKLAVGDGSRLKFHIGTITVKAEGYDDLVINLNKDYNESYLAESVSWGLNGNSTMITLNSYLPSDESGKTEYLKKVTDVIADITLTDYEFVKAPAEEPEFPADYTYPTSMRDISSMDLVKDMKVGWNLGNTLESTGGETGWGNPKTSKKMIDMLKSAGFNTVRIPVRWDEHYIDDHYTIDPTYMKRIETVANYALANDMYAIINIHHNALQSQANAENKAKVLDELEVVWSQIANHFKDYGDKLVFETINEPRNGEDWNGNQASYQIVNEYNAKALEAIRSTGANNTNRLVLLPTYTAGAEYNKIMSMVVPNDKHVAVSIHAYSPYNFALNTAPGSQSTFGDNDKAYLDKLFKLLNKTFVEKGVPVVIGEFAANNKDNLKDRIEYAYYYAQNAGHYGMPCFWWDNGTFTTGESMGLLNRRTLTFEFPEIVQALLTGWSTEKVIPETDPNVMFNGTGTSSNWGQAVNLSLGLDFVYDDFKDGSVIAVDYQSEKAPELILSGSASGVNWVKVNPTKVYEKVDSKVAYFTLTDMVNAYKNALSDYDSYGTIFPSLNTIYIGDTGNSLTVTKVYKTDTDGMKLPSVTAKTTYKDSFIDQSYRITSEQGDIDLSKVKIEYSATGMSSETQNVYCDYAGLLPDKEPWFTEFTKSVTGTIADGKLTIQIEKSAICPEKTGYATINIRFANKDWSKYGDISNPVLKVYYNGRLVQ